jgi:NAD(P)-dependent dehydrogenase (short-subunit alcohol dehydrogenase family)
MTGPRVAGKALVVTGGGSGIGRATALLFAEEGAAHVSVVDVDRERAERVAGEVKEAGAIGLAITADLTDRDACGRAIADAHADAGRVDVVVSNAGWSSQGDVLETTRESWDRNLAINLTAHFDIAQAAGSIMVDQRSGVLLFTTSASVYGGVPRTGPYGAAKAGLHNLVKTMALEFAPYGIRVNSVSPGATDTPLAESQVGKEVFDQMRQSFPVPLGRLARPEEIAHAFLYLASDDASYVTAFDLLVDSGTTQYAASFGQISESPDAP